MEGELEIKKDLQDVDCVPFLQRLILEDPDPSSPLYIPKPPPRSFETLSQAIKAGTFIDKNPLPSNESEEPSGGLNVRYGSSSRPRRNKGQGGESSKVQRQMADFHRGMDFAQDNPFSMGHSPFGGGNQSFGGEDRWADEDTGGIGEPLYPDLPQFKEQAERQYIRAKQNRYSEEVEDYEHNQRNVTEDGNDNEEGREEGEDEYEEGDYQEGDEEEDEQEDEQEDDHDESGFRFSEPMYAPGDEQLMEDARNLRERDGIPFHDSQDSFGDNAEETGYSKPAAEGTGYNEPVAEGTGYSEPVAEGTGYSEAVAEGTGYSEAVTEGTSPGETGSDLVQNEEEVRPRKKMKEKFARDREMLERRLKEEGPIPGQEGGYPGDPGGGGAGRLMSGREIQQQMAMQRLAAAALQAIASRGKGRRGGRGGRGGRGKRGGRVRVVFM